MKWLWSRACFLVLLIAVNESLTAQNNVAPTAIMGTRLKLVGQWPEAGQASARRIVVQEGVGYLAGGTDDLQIFDLSEPSSPKKIGAYNAAGDALALAVYKKFVYLILRGGALHIIDASDPSQLRKVGELPISSMAQSIDIQADIACIVGPQRGLETFELSDPIKPKRLGAADLVDGETVVMKNGCAYLSGGIAGLYVVDISDPKNPKKVGRFTHGKHQENVMDLAVADHRVYAADYIHGVLVWDIAKPMQPVYVGLLGDTNGALRVAVEGNIVSMVDTNYNLKVFEIESGTNAIAKGSYANKEGVFHISLFKKCIYLALQGRAEMTVLDLDPSLSPHVAYRGSLLPSVQDIAFAGTYGLAANGLGGVGVFHSNAAGVQWVRTDSSMENVSHIVASGNLALAGEANGLVHVLKAGAKEVTEVGSYRLASVLNGLSITNERGLFIYNDTNLDVIDLTDAFKPRKLASYISDNLITSSAFLGNHVIIGEKGTGLKIMDLGEDGKPVILAGVHTKSNPVSIVVQGKYALVLFQAEANRNASGRRNTLQTGLEPSYRTDMLKASEPDLVIMDLADPLHPRVAGEFEIDRDDDMRIAGIFRVHGIAIEGNLVYVLYDVQNNLGKMVSIIRVLELSDRQKPTLMSKYVLNTRALSLTAHLGRLYVSMGEEGLYILQSEKVTIPANAGNVYDYLQRLQFEESHPRPKFR